MCVDCQENSSVLPKGDTGATGATGTNGTNGNTILLGSGAPGAIGVSNYSYIDIDTFNFYIKSGSTWALVGSLKGTDGSGMVKFALSLITPALSAGTVSYTITAALMTTFGLITTSQPNGGPPAGQLYGTTVSDFILQTYEYKSSTNSWNSLYSRTSTSTDGTTGDVTVTVTGFATSPALLRIVLIG